MAGKKPVCKNVGPAISTFHLEMCHREVWWSKGRCGGPGVVQLTLEHTARGSNQGASHKNEKSPGLEHVPSAENQGPKKYIKRKCAKPNFILTNTVFAPHI